MTEDEPNPWAEIVGPCFTVARFACTLGWTEAEVLQAGRDLQLLMLHTSDDALVFPAFQLHDGKPVAGLAEVLQVLKAGVQDAWTWAQWLNVALPNEDPPRNITLLHEGRLEEALRNARHDAWSWNP